MPSWPPRCRPRRRASATTCAAARSRARPRATDVRGVELARGTVRYREDLPAPARAGETRVRVRVAGICATDLALRRGYLGFAGVPGHEFVGEALDGPLAGRR